MDSRVVVTVVIGLAAFIVLLAFFWCPARRKGVYSDPTICAEILACKGYGIAKSKNLHTPLESRAIPNERLVRAYGIDNSFTTTNKDYSNEFSKIAGSRLNLKEAEVGIPSRETFSRDCKNAMLMLRSCSGKRLQPLQRSSFARLFPHQI